MRGTIPWTLVIASVGLAGTLGCGQAPTVAGSGLPDAATTDTPAADSAIGPDSTATDVVTVDGAAADAGLADGAVTDLPTPDGGGLPDAADDGSVVDDAAVATDAGVTLVDGATGMDAVTVPDATAPDVAPWTDVTAVDGGVVDPAVVAYQRRVTTVLHGTVTALQAWGAANAAVTDNANPRGLSMWTAAAGFSQGGTDPTVLAAARKLAAGLLEARVTHLFGGGNDGWPAWATADTRVRHATLIAGDPARYAPAGYPPNAHAADGRYSLEDLFRIVLTQSYYAPIDSTSNHYLMNATARFLAEMAYPGQVVRPFNSSTTDPTGANDIVARAGGLARGGPAEYGSPNYGADNWGEFLSLSQLTTPSTPLYASVQRQATTAYGAALADMGAFWMNGNLAMPTGRGYPSTGAWGVAAGDVLTWVYFGGDFGNPNIDAVVSDTGEKTLGVLGAEGLLGGYTPPAGILHLADPVPRVTQADFGQNHQYAYLTANYGHSIESYKYGAHGGWQTHWDSRVIWTKPTAQSYQATAWVANVGVDATLDAMGVPQPTLDSAGNPISVDPISLRPYPLYGSGTYGTNSYEDFTQDRDTVLHVYNIPPRVLAGTPGGTMPVRGALIYTPIPQVQNTAGAWVTATTDYIPPQISSDGQRVFVGYSNVFISFNSSAPIATPVPTDTIAGRQQFFRIYGGPAGNTPVDQGHTIQFAVAVQTASPGDYPGATLAARFAAFTAAMLLRPAPAMVVVDPLHPVWRFSDGRVTLSNTYQGDRYHGGNDGMGQDWLGGPANEHPTVIDYSQWPMLREQWVSGEPPLVYQPQGGNLSVGYPGTPAAFYDFDRTTLTLGANINLSAVSNAAGAVALTWTGGLGQTGWLVERSSDGVAWTAVPGAISLPATAPGFTDTGLTQGGSLLYRVTPLGTSLGPSAPVSVAVDFAAPTDLQFQVTAANAVRLSWTNNAVGASNTRIEVALDGSEQWSPLDTRPPTQNVYTVGGIASGARRYYRVLAVSATATSAPSNRVGAEVTAASVGVSLSMPEYLTATGGASLATLAWVDTATHETGYRVERQASGETTWTTLTTALPADSTAYTDTTAVSGTRYAYRVAATSATAQSAYSTLATALIGH